MKRFDISKKYNSCRTCNDTNLVHFFHVDDLPMPEGHVENSKEEYGHNLDIYWCRNCGMVQTQVDLNLDKYYEKYVYTTSESSQVENYMNEFSVSLINKYGLKKNKLVVEVGSGDGIQLSKFKEKDYGILGVEPSEILAKRAEKIGVPTIISMFDTNTVKKIVSKYKDVSAVIIQYTFDHLQNPALFVRDVETMLMDQGILVIEVHDFEKIYARNEACLFTHEHSIYPTLNSLNTLLLKYNMKVIGTSIVDEKKCRGNSMIVVAAKSIHSMDEVDIKKISVSNRLNRASTYSAFNYNIKSAHYNLKRYLQRKRNKGIVVAGYGAAGRGVNTLVMANIDNNLLSYIYDMNKGLHGKKTPVSRIDVCPPEQLFNDNPDEMIVFSYGYLDEIKEMYKDHPVKIISMLSLMNN